MKNNLQTTKNKLTLIFSVIVFWLTFLFGSIFLWSKYINSYYENKNTFIENTQILWDTSISKNDIKNFTQQVDKNITEEDDEEERSDRSSREEHSEWNETSEIKNTSFINHIQFDANNKIVFSNIKDEIDSAIIYDVLDYHQNNIVLKKGNYFIKKYQTQTKWSFIVLYKLKYGFSQLVQDISIFLIFNLLFSALIYSIGNIFIKRVLQPVEENLKTMEDFVHHAGHELKSPLCLMDSNIQLMMGEKKYDKKMMWELKWEISKNIHLINALIELSDIGKFKKTQKVCLTQLLEQVTKDGTQKIDKKNITLNCTVPKSYYLQANIHYTSIFLSNIIGNAIKYNIDGWQIDIYLEDNTLTIRDNGIGIKQKELKKIWDRFYQVDRSRNSEWFGIGLALVKKIAGIYNWDITIQSTYRHGTSVKIKFR